MKKKIVAALAAVLGAGFLLGNQVVYAAGMPKDTIADGIFIDDMDMSGMTIAEAVDAVDAYIQDRTDSQITLNINEGYNKELMEQCQILREYAQYVGKVRKYRKVMELDAAVEHAVDECIREGTLKDFLQKNRVEVLKVSIFEYDQEEEEKKLRKAEFEAGYDTGVMDKVKEIIQYMLKSGEPVEKIARYTGYTVEEVKEIIKTSQ